MREEAARQKGRAERLEAERREISDQLQEVRSELASAHNLESTVREQEKRFVTSYKYNTEILAHIFLQICIIHQCLFSRTRFNLNLEIIRTISKRKYVNNINATGQVRYCSF